MREGKFISEWAEAIVTPIPKSGDLRLIKKWRPIHVVPIVGKLDLLEKLVHSYLYTILEFEDNLLAPEQFVYCALKFVPMTFLA